jgi:hypothetical protein
MINEKYEEIEIPLITICNYEVMEIIKYLCPTLIKYISKNTKKNTDDVKPIYIMSDRN